MPGKVHGAKALPSFQISEPLVFKKEEVKVKALRGVLRLGFTGRRPCTQPPCAKCLKGKGRVLYHYIILALNTTERISYSNSYRLV